MSFARLRLILWFQEFIYVLSLTSWENLDFQITQFIDSILSALFPPSFPGSKLHYEYFTLF